MTVYVLLDNLKILKYSVPLALKVSNEHTTDTTPPPCLAIINHDSTCWQQSMWNCETSNSISGTKISKFWIITSPTRRKKVKKFAEQFATLLFLKSSRSSKVKEKSSKHNFGFSVKMKLLFRRHFFLSVKLLPEFVYVSKIRLCTLYRSIFFENLPNILSIHTLS